VNESEAHTGTVNSLIVSDNPCQFAVVKSQAMLCICASFRAHDKLTCRIVSYRIVSNSVVTSIHRVTLT